MAKQEKIEKQEEQQNNPSNQLLSFLKDNKEFHYNFEEDVHYRVSSGSLLLDLKTNGGIEPGLVRMSGISEGGKTSQTLAYMKNFLGTIPNSRGLLCKAEGRLPKEMMERSGIKFVFKPEEWINGTCFVFECNIFETNISLIRELVKNNPDKIKYFIAIDSMDALISKIDLDRNFEDSAKVGAGAMLSSIFLKKMSLAFSKFGHICIIISQVRSTVVINPQQRIDPKLTNASGGSAQNHFVDIIMEFQPRYKEDIIFSNKKEEGSLGHYAKVIFRKSSNEKTGDKVKYPIRYGRKNGNSIWIEHEIVDVMLMFDFLKKNGAWFNLNESLMKEIRDKKLNIEEKYQGIDSIRGFLEENPETTQFLLNKIKKTLLK